MSAIRSTIARLTSNRFDRSLARYEARLAASRRKRFAHLQQN